MPGTFDPTNDAPAVATHSHKIKGQADVFEHVVQQMNTVSDLKMRLRQTTIDTIGKMSKMLSAPDQCEFMEMLMKMTGAKRGVEVGVFTGYSALCMALGLPDDGQLICCDISEEWVSVGRPFWEEAGVANKIETRIGPGLESLDAMVADEQNLGAFDFAYIDADKGNYLNYCERLLQLLKPNGFIMLDNTLW